MKSSLSHFGVITVMSSVYYNLRLSQREGLKMAVMSAGIHENSEAQQ